MASAADAADAAPNPLQSELPFYLFGALLAVYAVSRMLAQRPSLVWGRVHGLGSAMAHVQSVAHRGGRETTTENSQAAFSHAVDQGMHMVEFDVHLTKDNHVVVFHDGDLERMCVAGAGNRKKHVNDVNFKDLPMLKLPSEIRAGTKAGPAGPAHIAVAETNTKIMTEKKGDDEYDDDKAELSDPHPRQRIPLLTTVLSSLPATMCMTVEIKADPHDVARTRDLVERTDAILKAHALAHDAAGRVIWFSLQAHANNNLLPACNPERPRITSARDVALFILAYWCGLLPFLPTTWIGQGAACCGIVNPSSITIGLLRRVPGLGSAPVWLLERLLPALRPILAPPSMVAHLRKRGMAVYMLGVNDATALALANRCGVDAVLTDRPRWLADSAGLCRRVVVDEEKKKKM